VNAVSSQHDQTKTIRIQLLNAMTEGEYAQCDRLPRESILSEKLGISRTQLRDILAALEREGFITRRHGVGTIINHYVLNARTRMDIEVEFLDMIRQSGFSPAVSSVQVSESFADEKTAAQLQIAAGDPILRVSRLCTADGRPAIYCVDLISKKLVKQEYTLSDLKLPIFHFLQQFCGVSAYLDLTDLKPILADAVLSELLQVPVGAPLLFMDEVDYDIDGNPIFCSREYFVDGIFRHTVLRKKL
jgi:GntR family transcriptional regulator